jgi:hypothetical protein
MDERMEAIARDLQDRLAVQENCFTRAAIVTIGRRQYPAALYTTDEQQAPDDCLYVVGRRPAYEALVPADDPDTVYLAVYKPSYRLDVPYEPYRCYLRVARAALCAPWETFGVKRVRQVQIHRLPI